MHHAVLLALFLLLAAAPLFGDARLAAGTDPRLRTDLSAPDAGLRRN